MARIVIMTDEIGWHTRQLQAALRARGASGRCVDLADCHVD
ncbi:MAG TPA: RimK family alpha-L-glutamate ligase, partial [Burkholderiaceae bacterium]